MERPGFWESSCDVALNTISNGHLIDIFIFHGLGEAISQPRPLEARLAKDLPDARILSWDRLWSRSLDEFFSGPPARFAHFAYLTLLELCNKREENKGQQKPIILLGLSLGGIILKLVLFSAARDPRLKSIIECIQGVLFVGTPHREDKVRSYSEILASIGRHIDSSAHDKHVHSSLYHNSEAFRELTSSWHYFASIPTYSFSETKPIDGLNSVLVSKHSATIGTEGEVHASITANHLELNQLIDQEIDTTPAYVSVYQTLEKLIQQGCFLKKCQISERQTAEISQLLSQLAPYRCPVCATFPSNDLPVGIDAPRLEYLVDFDLSTRSKLIVWSYSCPVANFAYQVLLDWEPRHDKIGADDEEVRTYFHHQFGACVRPLPDRGEEYLLSTEHDVPFIDLVSYVVVHADPLSEATKRQFHTWIEECDNGHCSMDSPLSPHPTCNARPNAFLPSRLLEVRDLSNIRLRERGEIQESGIGKGYATLSHCWGSSRSFLTTEESLPRMKKGFCLSEKKLPKTFHDAIMVAYELGIPYLWIDSLCIIQDNTADWNQEASEMAQVYTNSYITIAALNSEDDKHGFLHQRSFRYITLRLISPTGQSATAYLSEGDPDAISRGGEEPLTTRGWVLQEQYLSPRTLWFSSKELGWKCKTTSKYESKYGGSSGSNLYLKDWSQVLTEFSRRNLTYDTDKLPALAGVASTFSNSNQRSYWAGLWKDELPRSLLFIWKNATSPSEYLAPSWSWAALNGSIQWRNERHHKILEGVVIKDFNMRLLGSNQFGRLKEGCSLTIVGPFMLLRPWQSTNQSTETKQYARATYRAVNCESQDQEIWCHFDHPNAKPREVAGLLLAAKFSRLRAPAGGLPYAPSELAKLEPRNWRVLLGILVAPVEGNGSRYKRVGFFRTQFLGRNEGLKIVNGSPAQEIMLY